MAKRTFTRRELLAGGGAGAAALGLAAAGGLALSGPESVERAVKIKPSGTGKVEHVVFLMQENRSFDHYFGTMKGVAGFDDPTTRLPSPRRGPGPVGGTPPECCSPSTWTP